MCLHYGQNTNRLDDKADDTYGKVKSKAIPVTFLGGL
jgi:hypothetical protein